MEFTIIQAVLPSFAIAFLGYIYSVRDSSLDMKSIANLIYYIFSPCLVFSSLAQRPFHSQEFFMISFSVVVLIFGMMFVAWFYMKLTKITESGFYLPIIFMNTGNIALPMSLFLYGNDGLSKAIIFHLVNVVFLYSMGVFIVSRKTDLKEFFKIPFLYAAVVGVIVANFTFPIPENISKYVTLIGKAIDIVGKGGRTFTDSQSGLFSETNQGGGFKARYRRYGYAGHYRSGHCFRPHRLFPNDRMGADREGI